MAGASPSGNVAKESTVLKVDRDRCIGSGMCALTAPEVFDQDGDGRVLILTDSDDPETAELRWRAAALCPSGALTVSDRF